MQRHDCNDRSVIDSCGFITDGAAGQSHNMQIDDNVSLNSISNVYHVLCLFAPQLRNIPHELCSLQNGGELQAGTDL